MPTPHAFGRTGVPGRPFGVRSEDTRVAVAPRRSRPARSDRRARQPASTRQPPPFGTEAGVVAQVASTAAFEPGPPRRGGGERQPRAPTGFGSSLLRASGFARWSDVTSCATAGRLSHPSGWSRSTWLARTARRLSGRAAWTGRPASVRMLARCAPVSSSAARRLRGFEVLANTGDPLSAVGAGPRPARWHGEHSGVGQWG